MRIIKQLAILPTLAALAAAAVSCHDGADWLTPDTGRRIEVSINAPGLFVCKVAFVMYRMLT